MPNSGSYQTQTQPGAPTTESESIAGPNRPSVPPRQTSLRGGIGTEDSDDTMKNLRKTFAGIFGDMWVLKEDQWPAQYLFRTYREPSFTLHCVGHCRICFADQLTVSFRILCSLFVLPWISSFWMCNTMWYFLFRLSFCAHHQCAWVFGTTLLHFH